MKEYVMSLLGASLLIGILGTLCPKRHEKYLRLLSGLCMVALLIAPLPAYLEEADLLLPSLREETEDSVENSYEEIYHQTVLDVNVNQIEKMTIERINLLLSTNSDDVSVSIGTEEKGDAVVLKKAIVGIRGEAIKIDPREIRDCVEGFLNCPCEVVYR